MFHYAPIKLGCNWGSFHLSVLHTAVIVEVDRRNFPYVRRLGWRYNPSARPHGQFLLFSVFARHNNSGWQPIKLDDWPRQFTENRELWTVYLVFDIVCVRLENLDLDLEIRISDFAIESDIRKRVSASTNPSSRWISVNKSNRDLHLNRLIGKSKRGFGEKFSWVVFFYANCAWTCETAVLNNSNLNHFPDFSTEKRKKWNSRTELLPLKSVLEFRVWIQIRNPDCKILIRFPNRVHPC